MGTIKFPLTLADTSGYTLQLVVDMVDSAMYNCGDIVVRVTKKDIDGQTAPYSLLTEELIKHLKETEDTGNQQSELMELLEPEQDKVYSVTPSSSKRTPICNRLLNYYKGDVK